MTIGGRGSLITHAKFPQPAFAPTLLVPWPWVSSPPPPVLWALPLMLTPVHTATRGRTQTWSVWLGHVLQLSCLSKPLFRWGNRHQRVKDVRQDHALSFLGNPQRGHEPLESNRKLLFPWLRLLIFHPSKDNGAADPTPASDKSEGGASNQSSSLSCLIATCPNKSIITSKTPLSIYTTLGTSAKSHVMARKSVCATPWILAWDRASASRWKCKTTEARWRAQDRVTIHGKIWIQFIPGYTPFSRAMAVTLPVLVIDISYM